MIRFIDGPASGIQLTLKRAPLFLRVTRNAKGEWDALDQLTDTPSAGEMVTVYRRIGEAGWLHIDYTRKRSAWFAVADYRLVEMQPSDETARNTDEWRKWGWMQVKPTATATGA